MTKYIILDTLEWRSGSKLLDVRTSEQSLPPALSSQQEKQHPQKEHLPHNLSQQRPEGLTSFIPALPLLNSIQRELGSNLGQHTEHLDRRFAWIPESLH
jgi:hypothetical protein